MYPTVDFLAHLVSDHYSIPVAHLHVVLHNSYYTLEVISDLMHSHLLT